MIPLWLKVVYTALVVVVVVVYARKYALSNFLWFSDIALVLTAAALWLESSLLASTTAVGVLFPEILWNVSFFTRLFTGARITGLSDYMFDRENPRYLRGLSLFHVVLPVLLVWMIAHLGYSSPALYVQTALAWIVLPLTYWLTEPKDNVNWVFGPSSEPQKRIPPPAYLGGVMIAFPVFVYLPTHLMLTWLFGDGAG